MQSAGKKIRTALENERPLQIVGAVSAFSAMQAAQAGFKAIYLSGGGVAYEANGYPDLGITDMHDVLEEARKITATVDVPLLADIDVGWGGAFNIARTIKEMTRAGVAAVHMEDQVAQKRCGHRPNKELVSAQEMGDRIKAAVDAKTDPDFVVMARCDALAVEGLEATIERSAYYVECGADMIFAEAMTDLSHYQQIKDAVKVPLLANITEFGKTDLYTTEQLGAHGVDMALYPLSAFRAMAKAAETVYTTIRRDGTQKAALDQMQTRAELYDVINNASYEETLDRLFAEKKR
jgi:methylisocitrate lyase